MHRELIAVTDNDIHGKRKLSTSKLTTSYTVSNGFEEY